MASDDKGAEEMTQRFKLATDLFGRYYNKGQDDIVIPVGSHFDLEYDLDYRRLIMVINGE